MTADKTDQEFDDIFTDENRDEDETADVIRRALQEQGIDTPDDDDDGGLDQPEIEDSDDDDRVSQEQGSKIASDARLKSGKAKDKAAPEDEADDEGKADKAKADDQAEKETDSKTDEDADKSEPKDLTAAPVEDLLKEVPEKQRAEMTRRLSDADAAMAPFRTEFMQGEMERFGANPAQVASRLADLAQFAQQKPDEYIAWAATDMAASPDKVIDVFNAAASHLGYKVVKADAEDDDAGGDDDLFEDPQVKALKEENRKLKEAQRNQQTGPSFGPDVPERQQAQQAQAALAQFVNERDPATGQAKRPLFRALEPQIVENARAHRQQTGQPITVDDLSRIYDHTVSEMKQQFGVTPAAQAETPVVEKTDKRAAAAQRAKQASSNIDGTGQSATRQPASGSGDLDSVIKAAIASQQGQ